LELCQTIKPISVLPAVLLRPTFGRKSDAERALSFIEGQMIMGERTAAAWQGQAR
jgi:hypothetical protein